MITQPSLTLMRAQQFLDLPTWGGPRTGAGRKRSGERSALPHRLREGVRAYQPVHVTLRMRAEVWNLRSHRSFRVFGDALRGVAGRPGFAVVHFSVQGNHLHLVVEADGPGALSRGMRALSIRIARGLNRMMGRRGPVTADRYHAHVLRTPAEVRNALRYVLGNFRSHALRRGQRLADGAVDRYSSAGNLDAGVQRSLWVEQATAEPRTWLLRRAVDRSNPG